MDLLLEKSTGGTQWLRHWTKIKILTFALPGRQEQNMRRVGAEENFSPPPWNEVTYTLPFGHENQA